MSALYQFLIIISQGLLPIVALFSPKIRAFHAGRKYVFKTLKERLDPNKKTIWLHAASLGEFEQGVPVLEAIRQAYPAHEILLTFFSPSGYEVRKNTPLAHCVTYLPLDSFKNARRFVKQVNPCLALFVKYEVWPNYMLALSEAEIPTVLFSGIFTPEKIYFKWYGGFMKESLASFSHIFVQDAASLALLKNHGISKAALTGDTRFDQVHKLSLLGKALPKDTYELIKNFTQEAPCLVGGSIWPEDLAVLAPAISQYTKPLKVILAPHKIDPKSIGLLLAQLTWAQRAHTQLLSTAKNSDLKAAKILIIDCIGLLNSIYPLAQIAYVGGGFKTGLHNTLEAAVYGIPLAIGPKYNNFKEASDLVSLGGIAVLHNSHEGLAFLNEATNQQQASKIGAIQKDYITSQLGSTQKIMNSIKRLLS